MAHRPNAIDTPLRPARSGLLLAPVASVMFVSVGLGVAGLRADEEVDYVRDIKPIFRERCSSCHGVLKQEGGLRLDTAISALTGGNSGPALVQGNVTESYLIERVTAADEAERMPPEGEPLSASQIQILEKWIREGAAALPDERPDEDPRDHWSFRKPEQPRVPDIDAIEWNKNPIDRFIARRHIEHGVTPRGPADRPALLRRVSLDLTGLPPTREELYAFLSDSSSDAWDQVVNRLLESPQYGERWGRHWMDVWRYSDWFGRRSVPDVWNSAPQIWRWRDWIVNSLNADKSYARMIQEMLAADEILPYDPQNVYATGYLVRNWYALNPNDWMRNNVEHTAKAFLGLTYNCAHCHDHKYDPITQNDYFRMRAFFEPIGLRQDRVPGEADPGSFQEYQYSVLRKIVRLGSVTIYDRHLDAPTWFYTAGDERNRETDRGTIMPGLPEIFGSDACAIRPVELPSAAWYPASRPEMVTTILAEARDALASQRQELSEAQRTLVAAMAVDAAASGTAAEAARKESCSAQSVELARLSVRAAELKVLAAETELESIEARIAADSAQLSGKPEEETAQLAKTAAEVEYEAGIKNAEAAVGDQERLLAVAEQKPADDSKRQAELDAATKKLKEFRDALAAKKESKAGKDYSRLGPVYQKQSTGRRRALAEWIGSHENPLTARVAINHIWMRHFHAALVSSVFDFGRNGSPPTHPELLDWLAVEFMDSGWSMKHVHRLIVTSRTYQMSSAAGSDSDNHDRDPENQFLWKMNTGRMEAETVRDSLLFCAGKLDLTIGGQELENSEALTTFRRTVYYSCNPEADGMSPLGRLFDAPDPKDCYRRSKSVVPQQALVLTNSDLIHRLSQSIAELLLEQADVCESDELNCKHAKSKALIVAGFERILSRGPSQDEVNTCMEFLLSQQKILLAEQRENARVQAAAGLMRVLLNHNDFVAIR